MELIYGHARFRLVVRDDGCGIDPHILRTGRDGHWGLSGMRERAERMGARLHVFSPPVRRDGARALGPGRVAFQNHRLAASAGGVTEAGDRTGRQASGGVGEKPLLSRETRCSFRSARSWHEIHRGAHGTARSRFALISSSQWRHVP